MANVANNNNAGYKSYTVLILWAANKHGRALMLWSNLFLLQTSFLLYEAIGQETNLCLTSTLVVRTKVTWKKRLLCASQACLCTICLHTSPCTHEQLNTQEADMETCCFHGCHYQSAIDTEIPFLISHSLYISYFSRTLTGHVLQPYWFLHTDHTVEIARTKMTVKNMKKICQETLQLYHDTTDWQKHNSSNLTHTHQGFNALQHVAQLHYELVLILCKSSCTISTKKPCYSNWGAGWVTSI